MKLLFSAVIAAWIFALPALAMADLDDMSTIDVSAETHIKSAPDVVLISAGVITNAPTAQAALKQNALDMTAVQEALKTAEVPEKDVQTSGINLNAQYDYRDNTAPRVTGYQATNTVNVTLHNLENTGKVIDALVAEGANQINGPTFSIENPDELLDKARAEAVHKAERRAQAYAAAMGMHVKRLISMSESSMEDPGPRPMMMRAMSAESKASTPISPGQINLGITINAKYELAP